MKANVLNAQGEIARSVELPDFFSSAIREDIILKVYLASLQKQPYAPYLLAGMQHSASGKIRHARRKWKTAYGYGIARVPRKIHTKRGSRFFWVGATITSARGGREAHPPKVEAMLKGRKINKKEKQKAIIAALAATTSLDAVKKKYATASGLKVNLPLVFDSAILNMKTKDLKKLIGRVLGEMAYLTLREREVRHGKGKARGRRYKIKRGLLIITASQEKMKCGEFETTDVKHLNIGQLASGGMPGRLVAYTEKAIDELKTLGAKK